MRPGLNRAARVSSRTSRISVLLFTVFICVGSLVGNGLTMPAAVALVVLLPIGSLLAVLGIIFGSIGLKRSHRLGGLGVSIYGLGVGCFALLLTGVPIVLAVI
jgi:hypothetical protein